MTVDAVATPAVSLAGVTYRYPGSSAGVFDVSLEILPGELVVCIGPSGCGKTTLLRLVAGFLRPEAGTIRLGGEDVSALPPRARECGVVFQAYALFPHMRVWENVAYPLRVRGVAPGERRRRAEAMLEVVGLRGLHERLPAQLSGGQQQRVALARALVFEPRAMLLDEPLSALDAATRLVMRDEIRRIQRGQDIATFLITHDQDEALSLADRIVVLRDGRLVQTAPPQDLYDRPADAFVAGFVGRDRGYRALGFAGAGELPLSQEQPVAMGSPLRAARDQAVNGWTLVVDSEAKPLGWLASGGLREETLAGDITPELLNLGGTLATEAGTLREALDAALSSPSGRGVIVHGDGTFAGTVTAGDVLGKIESRAADIRRDAVEAAGRGEPA